MRLAKFASAFSLLLVGVLTAQDDDKLISGPQQDKFVPGPFECMNLNGAAKGRPRCLVCKFALSPAVLIFAQHPATDENDETLVDLLKKLDDTMAEFHDDRGFSVGIVFLSPDARDSTNTVEDKSEEILKEALLRQQLTKRLSKRAEQLKHVIVAYHLAEGPKKYNINPKAQYTILFYERLKVVQNWTYAQGKMEAKDVETMATKIRDVLPTVKKKPAEDKN